nr:hypothetical protein [Deltaproteobacteria bacterium]
MNGALPKFIGAAVVVLGINAMVSCDIPECIDGPSNLTPEATASCVAPPAGTTAEEQIVSAGAQFSDDGTLILTWSSWGLTCGTQAFDVDVSADCETDGWVTSLEIPPALLEPEPGADPGAARIIDLSMHPEIRGTTTVIFPGGGASGGTFGDDPTFAGRLELVGIEPSCVTG